MKHRSKCVFTATSACVGACLFPLFAHDSCFLQKLCRIRGLKLKSARKQAVQTQEQERKRERKAKLNLCTRCAITRCLLLLPTPTLALSSDRVCISRGCGCSGDSRGAQEHRKRALGLACLLIQHQQCLQAMAAIAAAADDAVNAFWRRFPLQPLTHA